MRWWWFWRENKTNKIPLIPTPHFSFNCHISMVSSLLPPWHPPMHFYCFQHHQHHISILLSPPSPSPKQPHFSSFPSTTTTLLYKITKIVRALWLAERGRKQNLHYALSRLSNWVKGELALISSTWINQWKLFIAGLPRARSARGTEPHTHGIWSTSFLLVVTWLTERTYVRTYASTDCTGGVEETIKRKGGVSQACLGKSTSLI